MSFDITRCLEEEYGSFRDRCAHFLRCSDSQKKEQAINLLSDLAAHTLAEEEVLYTRALELEELRPLALKSIEENALAEAEILRLWQSADYEQFAARANVVLDLFRHQWKESEEMLFPVLRTLLSEEEREVMAIRYRESKDRHRLSSTFRLPEQRVSMQHEG